MNEDKILSLLTFSGQAYGNDFPVNPKEKITVIDNPKSGIQCQIRRRTEKLIISFRGTNSFKDGLTDAKFWRCKPPLNENGESPFCFEESGCGIKYGKIKIHCGFYNAYKTSAVRSEILKAVMPEIKKIEITGHSYGAALAILSAWDLQQRFPSIDYEVVVFGCPRVGNRAFAREYNNRIFKTIRVENGNDAVTKIPFSAMGYRHVGITLHIGKLRIPFMFSVKDHHAQEYYSNLLKCPCLLKNPDDNIGI